MLCYRDVRTSHCEHFSKLKSRDYHGPLGRRNGGNNALDKATIQQKGRALFSDRPGRAIDRLVARTRQPYGT